MASTKVVTGTVRGSYLTLFEPRAQDQNKPDEKKYSMVILIPKSDKTTLNAIAAAQKAAVDAKWPGKPPAKINYTLHDGNGAKENGEPYGPECKDCMVMSVSSKNRPGVVDQNVRAILDPTMCVSGDYFRVEINAYGYDYSGKKGVSFGLNNVQFVKKGDPLGNISRPEDSFSAVEDDPFA